MYTTKIEGETEGERRFTFKEGHLCSYRADRIKTLSRSFFAMLESFQIEVFLFLVSTNGISGTFKYFIRRHNIFARDRPDTKLNEIKINRALSICQDVGFLKSRWHIGNKYFYRKYENKHEVIELVNEICKYFIRDEIEMNTILFRSLD